jgi:hypothetical protein
VRANNSTGLRVSASNADIDATFESITTSGVAKVKDVHKVLWPLAVKSDIQDPRVTKFLEEAEACRVEAAAVQKVIEALKVSNDAEQEVRSVQGSDAPVEAQIGFILRKRNMKLGEVLNKWGNVTKITFRNRVRELGVIAGDERIDHVFSLIDVDNGGTLDTEELKEGLKLLVDAARRNLGDVAELEKVARIKRKAACALVREVAAQERERNEKLQAEEEARKRAEEERVAVEQAKIMAAAKARAEVEAKKKAEKAALLASMGRAAVKL